MALDQKPEIDVYRRALWKGVMGGLLWRLLLIAAANGSIFIVACLRSEVLPVPAAFLGAVVGITIIGILYSCALVHEIDHLSTSLAAFSAALFWWWWTAIFFDLLPPEKALFFLLLIVTFVGLIPSLSVKQDGIVLILLFLSVLQVLLFGFYIEAVLVFGVGFLSFRNSLLFGLQTMVSIGSLAITRMRQQLTEPAMRTLVFEGLTSIFRVPRFGVVWSDRAVELFVRKDDTFDRITNTPLTVLAGELLALEGEAGILRADRLPKEFRLRLRAAFGPSSHSIVFFSMQSAVADGTGYRLFFPIHYTFTIPGKQHVFRLALLYLSIIGQEMRLARHRHVKASQFDTMDQQVEQQRIDLGEIIHIVNNVAQESSSLCEQELRTVSSGSSSYRAIRDIGHALFSLAADVSDVRLSRELSPLINEYEREQLYLIDVQETIERYTLAMARRFGLTIATRLSKAPDSLALYENESLLLIVLRCIIRRVMKESSHDTTLELKSVIEDGKYQVELRKRAESKQTDRQQGTRLTPVDRAVLSHLDDYEGLFPELNLRGPNIPAGVIDSFSITLPVRPITSAFIETQRRNWLLFVDDNEQILQLYEKISVALGYQYSGATSVADALKTVKSKGAPALIVTDWSLTDGLGRDLIQQLQEMMTELPPVMIISGEEESRLRFELTGIEVARYLQKPISQQKLIMTLQQMLKPQ